MPSIKSTKKNCFHLPKMRASVGAKTAKRPIIANFTGKLRIKKEAVPKNIARKKIKNGWIAPELSLKLQKELRFIQYKPQEGCFLFFNHRICFIYQ
jgi:hypothetical protein